MGARIGLTQLPGKLADITGQTPPNYRKCFDGAVSRLFPAHFSGSRWTVDEEDLEKIALAMGLAPKPAAPTAAAKPRRRRSAAELASA